MKNESDFTFAKEKPWYKVCSMKNIRKDKNAKIRAYFGVDYDNLCSDDAFKISSHAGYMADNMFAILPYRGRHGIGVIVVTHRDKVSVWWKYHIIERTPQC